MWTIHSNDVEQAKERLEIRRAMIETKYCEDKKAVDAEFEAIETLERVAAEFAARLVPDDQADAAAMPRGEPGGGEPGGGEPGAVAVEADAGMPSPVEAEPATEAEVATPFDILKPGSRWRLNRGARAPAPEPTSGEASPTPW